MCNTYMKTRMYHLPPDCSIVPVEGLIRECSELQSIPNLPDELFRSLPETPLKNNGKDEIHKCL